MVYTDILHYFTLMVSLMRNGILSVSIHGQYHAMVCNCMCHIVRKLTVSSWQLLLIHIVLFHLQIEWENIRHFSSILCRVASQYPVIRIQFIFSVHSKYVSKSEETPNAVVCLEMSTSCNSLLRYDAFCHVADYSSVTVWCLIRLQVVF